MNVWMKKGFGPGKRKPWKGFTLIELLVVVAVISILAAILFPVFARARVAAYKTGSLSNLKQIGIAFMLYQQDYDDRTMPSDTFANRYPPKLIKYLKTWDVLCSPMQTGERTNPRGGYLDTLTPDYGYNTCYLGSSVMDDYPDMPSVCLTGPYFSTYSMASIVSPSETIAFVSSTFMGGDGPELGFHRVAPPSAWPGTMPVQWDTYGYNWPRYNGMFAVAFLDGHVKTLNIAQLSDETIWDRN